MIHVDVEGNYITDNFYTILEAARQGVGIANLFHYISEKDLKQGTLIPVLSEYKQERLMRYALYHQKRELSPKLDVFLTFLSEYFSGKEYL